MKTPNMIKHCPKDCLRNKTCFRGQPIPYNKRNCYAPPYTEILFSTKSKADIPWEHHYKNIAAYSKELERELKEHKRYISLIAQKVKIGQPKLAERLTKILDEEPKYL